MKENFRYHMALGSYLSTADRHYLDGRILWFSNSPWGAGMPLWLATEQMIKLFILQARVENKTLGYITFKRDGIPVTLTYSPTETNMEITYELLSRSSHKLSPKHEIDPLIAEMVGLLDISSYKQTLEKIHELYERRYYVNLGSSIPAGTLENLDEVYFKLRNALSKNIPRSLIDEIAYQRKFNTGHPLRNFMFAYHQNPHFQAKEHPVVYQALPDGQKIANDGINDSYVISMPAIYPLHPAVKKLDY